MSIVLPVLLSVGRFAAMTGFSRPTIHKLIRDGMPAVRVDRHWRVEVVPALAWMRSRSAAGGER